MTANASYRSARRFGVIIPAVNVVFEREMAAVVSDTVSFHYARLPFARGSDEAVLLQMAEDAPAAARLLAEARPDRILYACTSGSLIGGPGFDERLSARLSEVSGIPTTTTVTQVVSALRACGIERIGLATPYLEWMTEAEATFLDAAGFRTVSHVSLGLTDGHDMASLHAEDIRRLAFEVDRPEADGVFLSCTDLPTFGVLEMLEQQLGKPVISSNSASLWGLLGSRQEFAHLGVLFRRRREG